MEIRHKMLGINSFFAFFRKVVPLTLTLNSQRLFNTQALFMKGQLMVALMYQQCCLPQHHYSTSCHKVVTMVLLNLPLTDARLPH